MKQKLVNKKAENIQAYTQYTHTNSCILHFAFRIIIIIHKSCADLHLIDHEDVFVKK